jgi:hypothetical protein
MKERKGGIDDLVTSYAAQPIDEVGVVQLDDSVFETLLEQYQVFVDDNNVKYSTDELIGKLKPITEILTPDEINRFLQCSVTYEQYRYYAVTISFFITKLIQNSHDAGHNEFVLDLSTLTEKLFFLGYKLQGTEERPLQIELSGDTGGTFGSKSHYLTTIVHGEANKNCAPNSRNFVGTFHGNVGRGSFFRAESITVTLYGEIGDQCGIESVNGTYRTPNKETAAKLLYMIPEGNEVVYDSRIYNVSRNE